MNLAFQRQRIMRNNVGHLHPKASKKYEYVESIDEVREFLDDNYAPKTRKNYKQAMGDFLEFTDIDAKNLLALDITEIKRLIKRYVANKATTSPGSAFVGFYCMNSFFEYHRKKMTWQRRERLRHRPIKVKYTPTNAEVWKIAEGSAAGSNPRGPLNKAIVLFGFVTGLRSNAIRTARRGLLSRYTENDCPIPIKIWSDNNMDQFGKNAVWAIDDKLKQYNYDYIYTFVASDGFVAWKEYDDWRKRTFGAQDDNAPLFGTPMTNNALDHARLWRIFKLGVKKTAINPTTCSIHALRRSFKKVCVKAGVDFEAREAMMGHKIPGSAANYWDNHDPNLVAKEYMKCDWSGKGTHQLDLIQNELDGLKEENVVLRKILAKMQASNTLSVEERLARLEKMFGTVSAEPSVEKND